MTQEKYERLFKCDQCKKIYKYPLKKKTCGKCGNEIIEIIFKTSYPKTKYDGKGHYRNKENYEMECCCGCGEKIKEGQFYIRMGGGTHVKNHDCVLRYENYHREACKDLWSWEPRCLWSEDYGDREKP